MAEQKKDERTVRVHAREQDGIVQVKALIRHPMETGLRRDPTTGGFFPEHIITEGVVWVNGELVLEKVEPFEMVGPLSAGQASEDEDIRVIM